MSPGPESGGARRGAEGGEVSVGCSEMACARDYSARGDVRPSRKLQKQLWNLIVGPDTPHCGKEVDP